MASLVRLAKILALEKFQLIRKSLPGTKNSFESDPTIHDEKVRFQK